MKTSASTFTTLTASALAAQAADPGALDTLIEQLKSPDDKIRGPAWQGAGKFGARAIPRLADLMTDANFEVARAAKRALWQIIYNAGRPAADNKKRAVSNRLVTCLQEARPETVRRELLWLISELSGDEAVEAVATLLKDATLREDARMALQRLPGEASLAALKAALKAAPDDFKPNLAASLRQRGVEVPDVPCHKLVPTKKTTVTRAEKTGA